MNLLSSIEKLLSIKNVEAHCDVPCGIYDPITAKIAASSALATPLRIIVAVIRTDAASNRWRIRNSFT